METFKFFSGYENSINIELRTVNVQGGIRNFQAVWSPELSQDIGAFYNNDVEAELTALVSEQLATEIDREIIRELRGDDLIPPIAQRVASRTLGHDLVSVQPLSAPSSKLFFLTHKKLISDFKFFRGW